SLVWVLQRPPARTLQNAIIDSQQVEKKEGRKQTEILLKKDFDVEVGLGALLIFLSLPQISPSLPQIFISLPLSHSPLFDS
ncbi:MAG: hypothetical protein PUF27_07245, partial [Bacteroidales bacterium]|nr:hypothetical protein [Bacteroidales bacterium]